MRQGRGLSSRITAAAIGAFLLFLLVFNLTLRFRRPADIEAGIAYAKARVIGIENDTVRPDPDFPDIRIGRQDLVLEITGGAHRGEIIRTYNLVERIINNPARVGTRFIISSYDNFLTALVVDYDREAVVYGLAALFAAAVVALGRRKGARSLLALLFTLVCIFFFFIPLTVVGVDPILAALAVVAVSTVVTLWMLNGWSAKTASAVVGCVTCTFLAGLVAFLFGALARVTTMNTPEAETLLFVSRGTHLSFRHLLFAGVLFSSLGAITDTAMSISSSIFELRALNPKLPRTQLFRSGMNIGRDVMGTMTDTLILAFTGGSINTLVIFYMYALPYMRLINMQLLVVEILRGLSSSIAVVVSIPVTALLAVLLCDRKKDINFP
ncbi:MAG: YibE/F family protein [Oscillospiraceae bacterium]|jgi:uncharacterized membrane protein|nr:YibE/F family protein [Oscillospiraceae bacterium]